MICRREQRKVRVAWQPVARNRIQELLIVVQSEVDPGPAETEAGLIRYCPGRINLNSVTCSGRNILGNTYMQVAFPLSLTPT